MLKAINISNLALIDSLELEWAAGFNVLTGETGAGKSILIDAIGLAIGTRADLGQVRSGAERAEVSAEFQLDPNGAALRWLREQSLEDADDPLTVVIRRVVQAGGRGRAFVNGSAVTAAQLRALGELLVDIFGQSESQTLLRAEVQRELLDSYGKHGSELKSVAGAAAAIAAIDAEIDSLRAAAKGDPAQIDFLRFQVQELDALKLEPGELEQLDADHRRLASAGRLLQDGGSAQDRLYSGDETIYDQLSEAQGLIDGLVPLHADFRAASEAIAGAQAQIQDAADTIRRVLDHMELDPERLQSVESRLQAIHDTARKHRVRPDGLHAHHSQLAEKLDLLSHATANLAALERRRESALADYRKHCAALSAARIKAAKRYSQGVTGVVRTLGMASAQFVVVVEADGSAAVSAHGSDVIRFDFTANPGQAAKPLAKVASGGELSRVSLAIQVTGLQTDGAATMIFDEVDAGISGAVAEIVGQKLRALGTERQVLCVTHLAQVAAQGHGHYGIAKTVKAGQTYTQVRRLTAEQRVEEIARMQGGVAVTSAALEHARDLLQRAAAA
ncbi:MAG TPA: DNA repair protein RecN [Fontimonas sp.]